MRRLILTEDVLALLSKVDRLVDAVQELTTIQRQQAEQIRIWVETQQRQDEQIQILIQQVSTLITAKPA